MHKLNTVLHVDKFYELVIPLYTDNWS